MSEERFDRIEAHLEKIEREITTLTEHVSDALAQTQNLTIALQSAIGLGQATALAGMSLTALVENLRQRVEAIERRP